MTAGRVRVAMGDGVGIWVMDAPPGFGEPVPHAHHAIQLTLALHGHVRLFDAAAARTGRMQAVAADHPHGFSAEGRIAFVFVEPESEAGRAIAASLFGDAPLVDVDLPGIEAMAATLAAGHGDSALLDWAAQLADALTPGALGKPGAGATRADPRVQRIVDFVAAHIDEPLDLSRAAEGVFLSPSRLRHLFVEQTGLAFKTYVLWRRLMRAVRRYGEGASLTEAAHAAGFADSAHFSRTFKRTFGLPATSLQRLRPEAAGMESG